MGILDQLLGGFSLEERRKFITYLQSDYFSVPAYIRSFGTAYLGCCRTRPSELTEHQKWNQVYGGKPYNDAFWRKRKSELKQWVDRFLILNEFEQGMGPSKRDQIHFKVYAQRGIWDSKRALLPTIPHWRDRHELWELTQWNSHLNSPLRQELEPKQALPSLIRHLQIQQQLANQYHLLDRLSHYIEIRTLPTTPDGSVHAAMQGLIDGTMIQEAIQSEHLLLRVHGKLASALFDQRTTDYWEVVEGILSHTLVLPQREIQSVGRWLLRLGTMHYYDDPNALNAERLLQLAKLIAEVLPGEWLVHVISKATLMTLISMQSTSKVQVDPDQLMQDFQDGAELFGLIDGSLRQFCTANAHFGMKNFQTCLAMLGTIQRNRPLRIACHHLQLMVLYELAEWDRLEAHIANFERWLRRYVVHTRELQYHLTPLLFLKRMLRVRRDDAEAIRKLKTTLSERHMKSHTWLSQKLFELGTP